MAIAPSNYTWAIEATGTIPASTNSGQILIFTEANVDAAFWLAVNNGGGGIRACEDSLGVNQLPLHVIKCDTVTEELLIVTRKPSYTTSDRTVFLFANNTGSQPASTDTFGSQNVYQDELNAYLGDSLTDLTGNNNLTNNGSVTLNDTGKVGGAFLFSGSNYLDVPGYYPVTGSLDRSVRAWIKTSSTNRQAIISYGTDTAGAAGARWEFRQDESDNNQLRTEVNAGFERGVTAINDNAYNYVVQSYTGTNVTDVLHYLNGTLESVGASSSRAISTSSVQPLKIGAREGGLGVEAFWTGNINLLIISDYAISSSKQSTEYANQNSPSTFWTMGASYDPSAAGVAGTIAFSINAPTFSASGTATLPQPIGSVAFQIDKPTFSAAGSATLPQPSGSVAFSIGKPLFASTGSATLPNPTGSISFTVGKPAFSAVGSATLPNPTGNISFTVGKPVFSATGSATSPNPTGNASFTIDKPVFSAAGSATLPQPVGSVSFTIDKPTFAATGSATVTFPVGDIAFDISKPVFSATGSVTLPQPTGSVSFTIASPTFSATGTVSGLVISYADDAIITVDAGENILSVTYGANIIKI